MPGSLDALFSPSCIAVIGASANPRNLGGRIVRHLLEDGFAGAVYPVNPHGGKIGDLPIYTSLRALPQTAPLAIICAPRPVVLEIVQQCAHAGTKAIVVVSAGFAESDADGQCLQRMLAAEARRHGVRLVGPNCVGLVNTDSNVRLNATFCPVAPKAGTVGLCSQSGALGLLALALSERFNVGFSRFVSVGNEADVSTAELIEDWSADANVEVLLLYLESVTHAERFRAAASAFSGVKPIVAIQAGRQAAGQRAARSHTAALASRAAAMDAFFRQTGILRAANLDELLDLASFLTHQLPPPGPHVGVLTNAGGPAVLCADACEAAGLAVPTFSLELRRKLMTMLPPPAMVANPVDMLASAGPDQYRQATEIMLSSAEVDALIVIYVPVDMIADAKFLGAIDSGVAAARSSQLERKPVMLCLMSQTGERIALANAGETIPCCVAPDSAADVLGKAAAYARWRQEDRSAPPSFNDMHFDQARKVLAQRGEGWLSSAQIIDFGTALKLPFLAGSLAASGDEAVEAARGLGWPVVLKTATAQMVHKSDLGAVELDLSSDEDVHAAFARIQRRVATACGEAAAREGVLVQPMCTGRELVIGVTRDLQLGPLVTFGLGGTSVEMIQDVSHRLAPLTDRDAQDLVRSIRGYPLLNGFRGQPAADQEAIQELLLRVSQIAREFPELSEFEFNPVIALPPGQGCWIVDARVHFAPPPAH